MNKLSFVDACTQAHFETMSYIHSRGWRATYPGHVPDDYLRDVATEARWIPLFRENFETGHCHGLLLYRGEKAVACCNYGPAHIAPSQRQRDGAEVSGAQYQGWGELHSFYCDPSETGKGYGSLLIEEALRRLKAEGHSHCFVFVLRENDGARRFYARHGFAWDGTQVGIPFSHNTICVDVRYTKAL